MRKRSIAELELLLWHTRRSLHFITQRNKYVCSADRHNSQEMRLREKRELMMCIRSSFLVPFVIDIQY